MYPRRFAPQDLLDKVGSVSLMIITCKGTKSMHINAYVSLQTHGRALSLLDYSEQRLELVPVARKRNNAIVEGKRSPFGKYASTARQLACDIDEASMHTYARKRICISFGFRPVTVAASPPASSGVTGDATLSFLASTASCSATPCLRCVRRQTTNVFDMYPRRFPWDLGSSSSSS